LQDASSYDFPTDNQTIPKMTCTNHLE